ncbi:MarR family winged helix-turn-helix transcriptional regulator [Streptomyces kebangsaanensis]|uniref:MarR family winged helix-turn-helix transcriptional regulator n=1 Tax=Streptomyces kebangsaanensis TaxID=864058 RepID=A0ABW6L2F9_9ACTN
MEETHRENGPRATAHALAEVASAVIRTMTDRRGMSFTAASTLARLERGGPARLTALAVAEGVTQPSMTQLVQRLERQGLVTRVGDPGDGRVSLVAVTDTGRDVLAERRRARDARLAELLAGLPVEQQRELGAAMRTALPLVRRMTEDDARPCPPAGQHTGSTR